MFTTHHSAHHNAHYSAPTTAPPTVPTTAPTIAPTEQRVHKDARSPHAECRRSCLCPQGVSSLLVAGAPLQVHRPKTTSALADCTLLFRITCSPHAGGDCCTRSAATAHPPSTPALHAPARPARAQSASYGRQGAWLLGERSFWIALSLGAGGLPSYTCPWTSRASPLSTHPHRRAAPRAPCSRPRVLLALLANTRRGRQVGRTGVSATHPCDWTSSGSGLSSCQPSALFCVCLPLPAA